jgi:hypothetical protein
LIRLLTAAQAGALGRGIYSQCHPLSPSRPMRTSGISAGGAALANFFRAGSVDQVGMKGEMRLRIASLYFELSTLPGTATDQFKLPSGAPDARRRQMELMGGRLRASA